MTEAVYMDKLTGADCVVRDFYAINSVSVEEMNEHRQKTKSKHSNPAELFKPFTPDEANAVMKRREKAITKYVESTGGKLLSVRSELISKRRYKRNVAKANAKLSKR